MLILIRGKKHHGIPPTAVSQGMFFWCGRVYIWVCVFVLLIVQQSNIQAQEINLAVLIDKEVQV